MNFADQLISKIQQTGTSLCVGLDPRLGNLPTELRQGFDSADLDRTATAFADFCRTIIDEVKDLVPIVKPQSAFFEALGPAGVNALAEIVQYARQNELLVLMDAKRGDIGSTAAAYAQAYLGPDSNPLSSNALTVNPYMGGDTLQPFVEAAGTNGKGLFVLVKTSNPGSGHFQDQALVSNQQTLFESVADEVERLTCGNLGKSGFGSIGAVVGATYPEQLAELRNRMPHTVFLIPGFGAQGGSAEDVKVGFNSEGLGAIVNSSRGIIFAYEKEEYQNLSWQTAIRRECEKSAELLSVRQMAR